MENRLNKLFETKRKEILNIYFTAGYPRLEDTEEIIELLSANGADIIELGMPFSDPIADGPTIQESNKIALDNGMNLRKMFEQLGGIRDKTDIPLVLMGYLNPVIQMGLEKFCQKCQEVGIDALIIPDLPVREYQLHYQEIFRKYGLSNVFLITPNTSDERIHEMDKATDTFIYMVSSPSITGAKKGIDEIQMAYFKRINEMNLTNPTLIGFGISDRESFMKASEFSSGAIIGSAFINALKSEGELSTIVPKFLDKILKK